MSKECIHFLGHSVYTLRSRYGNMSSRYNKVSTQWDPISFTVSVKITYH